MLRLIILILLMAYLPVYMPAQTNSYTDSRDGSTYSLVEINGKLWFGENLRIITAESFFQNLEEAEVHGGNYYPYYERQDLCPKGWKITSVDDWRNYFDDLIDALHDDIDVNNYSKSIEKKGHLYAYMTQDSVSMAKYDILNVEGTFGVQKDKIFDLIAHAFWVINPTDTANLRYHAHLGTRHLSIHSHKQNITRWWQQKRRFAVRCVCEIDK